MTMGTPTTFVATEMSGKGQVGLLMAQTLTCAMAGFWALSM